MGTYLERRLVIKNNAEIIKDKEDLNNTKYLRNKNEAKINDDLDVNYLKNTNDVLNDNL